MQGTTSNAYMVHHTNEAFTPAVFSINGFLAAAAEPSKLRLCITLHRIQRLTLSILVGIKSPGIRDESTRRAEPQEGSTQQLSSERLNGIILRGSKGGRGDHSEQDTHDAHPVSLLGVVDGIPNITTGQMKDEGHDCWVEECAS